jgi:hypothetical protein
MKRPKQQDDEIMEDDSEDTEMDVDAEEKAGEPVESDDDDEEEEEEEEDDVETEVMCFLKDEEESIKFDKLLEEIKIIEHKKMTDDELEDCEFLEKRGRRNDDAQYHLILQSDPEILRKQEVIPSKFHNICYSTDFKTSSKN